MTRADQSSSQRGKVLLIPVLLLGLGYVIWDGQGLDGDATEESSSKTKQEPPSASGSPKPSHTPISWPGMDLDSVLAHNPFARLPLSAETQEPSPPDPAQTAPVPIAIPRKPPALKVQAILDGSKGKVALIGGKLIQEGDILDGGWVVVGIDATGVLINPSMDVSELKE